MRISSLLLCAVTAWSAEPAVIPAELVGTWGYTETRAITYRNRSTGAFARPSGSSSKITIHPDGTFEDFDLIQQSMYNCTETVFIKRTGYVVTEGSSIALHYEGGHVSSQGHLRRSLQLRKASHSGTEDVRRLENSARSQWRTTLDGVRRKADPPLHQAGGALTKGGRLNHPRPQGPKEELSSPRSQTSTPHANALVREACLRFASRSGSIFPFVLIPHNAQLRVFL